LRTPAGVEVATTHGELYFQVSAGIEIYFTQIYAEQLNVEYHSHGPEPEKSIEAIRSLLVEVAEQYAGVS
jgi:phenolphthiocerol/phthiocerol/phthiodiolone dimycocerosyl transferase